MLALQLLGSQKLHLDEREKHKRQKAINIPQNFL